MTVAVSAPQKHLTFTEAEAGRGHVINATVVCSAGAGLTIFAEEPSGDVHTLERLSEERIRLFEANQLATLDQGSVWENVSGHQDLELRARLDEKWRLKDDFTYSLATYAAKEKPGVEHVATAQIVSPINASSVSISGRERLRFSLLLGMHRCFAKVTLDVVDPVGAVLKSYELNPDQTKLGGSEADSFACVSTEFVAPPGAAALRIAVVKGRTVRGANSCVFMARARLHRVGARKSGPEPVTVPINELRLLEAGDFEVIRLKLRPAESAPPLKSRRISLVASDGEMETKTSCVLPDDLADVAISRFVVEQSRVEFKGKTHDAINPLVQLGVYVDGELSGSTAAPIVDGQVAGSVSFDHAHLDGLPHAIELRKLPDQTRLAFSYEILPCRMTGWEAIREHSGAPFDCSESPAAPYHLRSIRAWHNAVERQERSAMPPLGALHDQLLAGPVSRRSYRPLTFPEQTTPQVSIVIPVHGKFEMTYNCLCSLLFAFNRASFEVIVVDDGSQEETTRIHEIVSGVKVVRHTSAMGFVHSCNDGAAAAFGEYVCFLNNDTEVTVGWIDELLDVFSGFDGVGLVGSKLLYPNGKLQEAGGIVWQTGNPWNVGRNQNPHDPKYSYLRQVDYISGAAILLPRELFERVGRFSQEFAPAYFEDTDLAMKVRAERLAVVFVPTSVVFHFEGQSAGTSVASGMKRFQEINRPKFKRKWTSAYAGHGREGERPDREKDRGAAFRVLFVDQRVPAVDNDAGSYAAFQEIRLLQAMGGKVTLLPRNLAWMDRHSLALQRIGVECLHAPFVPNFVEYLEKNAGEFDVVYVNRYRVAQQIVKAVRSASSKVKIVFNLADLHFLRELREAAAGTEGFSIEGAHETRIQELAMVDACDLTLTYSDIELAVLQSHAYEPGKVAKVPWVVDAKPRATRSFAERKDVLFLGGFGHPPNVAAVKFFAGNVLPALKARFPELLFRVVGSRPPRELLAMASDAMAVEGYVDDLDEAFDAARVFVVPLLAGAGIKGKVLEAMSRGAAMVVSPVAMEATALSHDVSCLVARTPEEWIAEVSRLYEDPELCQRVGGEAQKLCAREFSFEAGLAQMRDALASIEIYGSKGLHYKHARPRRYGP